MLGGTIGLLDEAIDPLTNTMPDGMPSRRISAVKGGMDCITPFVKKRTARCGLRSGGALPERPGGLSSLGHGQAKGLVRAPGRQLALDLT